MSLDAAAVALGVERRRIYDVVACLEGVGVVEKRRMNLYHFGGRESMKTAFERLRENAARGDGQASAELPDADGCGDSEEAGQSSRKDKSLLVLTQRMLQLFLASHGRVISLEEAADKLLGGESDSRTKIRRIYDVANVLVRAASAFLPALISCRSTGCAFSDREASCR